MVYISNRGKVQTPKSLALAMTVRQTFGCSGLIFKILSGFGHCLSLSLAMAYDSAIAQATINTSTLFRPVISDACGGQFLYQADVQVVSQC